MQVMSLLYHDVIDSGELEPSGFCGGSAENYKVYRKDFIRHLQVLGELGWTTDVQEHDAPVFVKRVILLTFDDGGLSFHNIIAPLLEERGYRGYFFVTTDHIGKKGFMSERDIQSLDKRGHVIGTHTCSHPSKFNRLPYKEKVREWSASAERLKDILAKAVSFGSIPGGYYSTEVGKAASEAGIKWLFTSEPTRRVTRVSNTYIIGRFLLKKQSDTEYLDKLVGDSGGYRLKQLLVWNAKKVLKRALGSKYEDLRRSILR
jgi:hypothetical protein